MTLSIAAMIFLVLVSLAVSITPLVAVITIAANSDISTITASNSTSVNPRRVGLGFMIVPVSNHWID